MGLLAQASQVCFPISWEKYLRYLGQLSYLGQKAYVAQSPWIQSGNFEENILFGMEMERERYEKVLEACSLKKDSEILPLGDQTVIIYPYALSHAYSDEQVCLKSKYLH